MKIAEWLEVKGAEGTDVSHIALPDDLAYDELPDETIFFEEINPCGIFCTENHPFSTVERFGDWFYCRGQDRERAFTPRARTGSCLQRIEISPS